MSLYIKRLVLSSLLAILAFVSCSSCLTTKNSRPPAPAAVQKLWPSIAKVMEVSLSPEHDPWVATGWAIDEDHLVTAGHFCESWEKDYKGKLVDSNIRIKVSDRWGMESIIGSATMIDYRNKDTADYCVLYLENHGLVPLPLASKADLTLVETEDPITICGAPGGDFPITRSGYIWAIDNTSVYVSIFITPGFSGAPIIWKGKVIGNIVALYDAPSTGVGARIDKINEFYKKTLEKGKKK